MKTLYTLTALVLMLTTSTFADEKVSLSTAKKSSKIVSLPAFAMGNPDADSATIADLSKVKRVVYFLPAFLSGEADGPAPEFREMKKVVLPDFFKGNPDDVNTELLKATVSLPPMYAGDPEETLQDAL
jgi:hypothetical protein